MKSKFWKTQKINNYDGELNKMQKKYQMHGLDYFYKDDSVHYVFSGVEKYFPLMAAVMYML